MLGGELMVDARAHTDDPDTAKGAASKLDPAEVSKLKRAIMVLAKASPRTPQELSDAYCSIAFTIGWPEVQPYSVNRRCSELKKAGLLFDTGMRRKGPYGRNQAVLGVPEGVEIPPEEYFNG